MYIICTYVTNVMYSTFNKHDQRLWLLRLLYKNCPIMCCYYVMHQEPSSCNNNAGLTALVLDLIQQVGNLFYSRISMPPTLKCYVHDVHLLRNRVPNKGAL